MANGTISVSQVDVLTTSGTGTISIVPPATNTNRTLTLPDSSGTLALAGTGLTGVTDSASPFETALGTGAGGSNTGTNNTFIGYNAGTSSTTGTNNTAVGYQALDANTTGASNIAMGTNALGSNTTGINNVAVGSHAMGTNSTGIRNVAMGHFALYENTTANDNTALGFEALNVNTTGDRNTAVGSRSLDANTTGLRNSAFGYEALSANTTANSNTALGAYALAQTTTGEANAAVGDAALYSNTTGANNTAVGQQALYANTTGANNTAVGRQALDSNTTGDRNTAVGQGAAAGITTGSNNICIGDGSGDAQVTLTSGTDNIIIGRNADVSGATNTFEIVIAAHGTNASKVGKGSSTAFINANGGSTFNGANSSSWNTTSDQRLKKNIVDNNEGLDKISAIRVRNFEYRTEEEVTDLPSHAVINKTGIQLGVIAQELQQVCPDCVTEQSTGVLSVDTDEIFWHMVNAIKDLKAINDAQAIRIEALETKVAALEAK